MPAPRFEGCRRGGAVVDGPHARVREAAREDYRPIRHAIQGKVCMAKRTNGEELERCKRALLGALVGALEGGLKSDNPRARRKAARLLGGMGDRAADAAPLLLEPLLGD